MQKWEREELNEIAQECSEYEPIEAAKNLAMAAGEDGVAHPGCDSCIHFDGGRCNIYLREREARRAAGESPT